MPLQYGSRPVAVLPKSPLWCKHGFIQGQARLKYYHGQLQRSKPVMEISSIFVSSTDVVSGHTAETPAALLNVVELEQVPFESNDYECCYRPHDDVQWFIFILSFNLIYGFATTVIILLYVRTLLKAWRGFRVDITYEASTQSHKSVASCAWVNHSGPHRHIGQHDICCISFQSILPLIAELLHDFIREQSLCPRHDSIVIVEHSTGHNTRAIAIGA